MRRPSSRVGLWALVVSLALHGALLTLIATRPPPPVKVRPRPAELIIVEVEPPKPAPPEPERARTPATPRLRAPPKPTETPAEPAPPLASDRPTSELPPEPRKAVRTVPRPSLVPDALSDFAISLDAGVYADDDAPRGLHAPDVAGDLVGELSRDTLSRGKIDRGLVHPYYAQLGKELVKHWDADRVAKAGLKGYGDQLVQNTKIFGGIWADHAEQYGRTGSPIDAPTTENRRGAVTNDRISGIPGVDLDARREVARAMREQFKATRRATIRVVQNRDGKLLKVELVEPSNDSNVDREALRDVRAAAELLPAPPADALQGRATLTSLWSFELIVSISPPVPTFTFEFDEVVGFIDARLPLDRRIYKKVRLIAVE